MEELLIGAHTSGAGGLYHALLAGQAIGATTVQLFTANQKQWNSKPLAQEEVDLFLATLEATGLSHIMSHDSYLVNLGSPNEEVLVKSRKNFRQELERCIRLGITYLNFHPGASLDDTAEACLARIVESLWQLEDLAATGSTRLLIETTAGQGSNVGWSFEHLQYIVDNVKDRVPVGVCIDTCHTFAAGYDIRTKQAWDKTLDEFDRVVGIEHLYAFHLNDSVKELGSRVDRHAPLGEGMIGLESFKFLMASPRTRKLPKYLETPGGMPLWEREIRLLKQFANKRSKV